MLLDRNTAASRTLRDDCLQLAIIDQGNEPSSTRVHLVDVFQTDMAIKRLDGPEVTTAENNDGQFVDVNVAVQGTQDDVR